mmetsp:Transcript_22717/g.70550  ORF Transcript_22717/g.70550 Transcript_22717/m.70550 type:complete len:265 (-) Transcript_22717:71-865(-)
MLQVGDGRRGGEVGDVPEFLLHSPLQLAHPGLGHRQLAHLAVQARHLGMGLDEAVVELRKHLLHLLGAHAFERHLRGRGGYDALAHLGQHLLNRGAVHLGRLHLADLALEAVHHGIEAVQAAVASECTLDHRHLLLGLGGLELEERKEALVVLLPPSEVVHAPLERLDCVHLLLLARLQLGHLRLEGARGGAGSHAALPCHEVLDGLAHARDLLLHLILPSEALLGPVLELMQFLIHRQDLLVLHLEPAEGSLAVFLRGPPRRT